jgi:hypothetical protein
MRFASCGMDKRAFCKSVWPSSCVLRNLVKKVVHHRLGKIYYHAKKLIIRKKKLFSKRKKALLPLSPSLILFLFLSVSFFCAEKCVFHFKSTKRRNLSSEKNPWEICSAPTGLPDCKIPIWVNFGGSCNGRCGSIVRPFSLHMYCTAVWSIVRLFGLFCCHLVYFAAIQYVYVIVIWYIFPPFW